MQLAASLPVVGLPVPEQQVSEPVPRGQGEHLLLQFDHGPPRSPETDIIANCTSTPRRWTPLKPTPLLFLLLFKTEINNEHIDTSYGIVFDLLQYGKKKIKSTSVVLGTRHNAALLFFPPRQQVELIRRCVREAPLLLWELESNWLSLWTAASSQPELRMRTHWLQMCNQPLHCTVAPTFHFRKNKKQKLRTQYSQQFTISDLLLHRAALWASSLIQYDDKTGHIHVMPRFITILCRPVRILVSLNTVCVHFCVKIFYLVYWV